MIAPRRPTTDLASCDRVVDGETDQWHWHWHWMDTRAGWVNCAPRTLILNSLLQHARSHVQEARQ